MNDPKISELTVSQLQRLIRQTVHEAVAEVMLEIGRSSETLDELEEWPQEAEMLDYLRSLPVSISHPHDD